MIIENTLPGNRLHDEVVLHVRRHLREEIGARGPGAARALAVLFGEPPVQDPADFWGTHAEAEHPVKSAAVALGTLHDVAVVRLGHGEAHIEACRSWMERRVRENASFERILADDLGTLLALSSTIDLANACQHGPGENTNGGSRPEAGRFLPVLVLGATGTGKELLAEAIHRMWNAKNDKPGGFHVVQVAGVPTDQIYAELFGAKKGAYTGLDRDRIGRIEAARGGTLLIDEVGDLPRDAQVSLLRYLQTRTITRLGDTQPRPASARVVAATWRNLDELVETGGFRLDLLHRIRGAGGILLPPLSARDGFHKTVVSSLLRERGVTTRLSRQVFDALRLHGWPGNLRELVSVIDALANAVRREPLVLLEHLPPYLQRFYLSLPLEDRIPGYICAESPDDHISVDLAEEHVAILQARILKDLIAEPDRELLAMAALIERMPALPDETELSRVVMEQAISTELEARKLLMSVRIWAAGIDAPELQPEVVKAVGMMSERLVMRASEGQDSLTRMLGTEAVRNNTWLRILSDLRSSAALSDVPTSELVNSMMFTGRFVYPLFPEFVRGVAVAYRSGGITAVREHIVETLGGADEDMAAVDADMLDGERDALRVCQARNRTTEEWEVLSKSNSWRHAKQRSGHEQSTILKYFEREGLKPMWL